MGPVSIHPGTLRGDVGAATAGLLQKEKKGPNNAPRMFACFRLRMKYKVCLSGYNKTEKKKEFKIQRVPQWEAELKSTVLVMSYLNSEFILLGNTQKQGFRQFWFGEKNLKK